MRKDRPSQAATQGPGPEPAGPEALVEAILQVLAAERVRRVLNLGCGRRDLSAKLVRRGYAITGVDPDPVALELAGRRVPGPTFCCAPATRLPCQAASFGAVVFTDAAGVLRQVEARMEIGRVLRRDGVLIAVTPVAEGPLFQALSAEGVASDLMPNWLQKHWTRLRSDRFDVSRVVADINVLHAQPRRGQHITGETLSAHHHEIAAAVQPEQPKPVALCQTYALHVLRKI